MKQFKPTHLYIKTHNKTGLKYFGKTTADPFRYYGSGVYWLAHLRKNGYDISTEVIGFYEIEEECINAALQFSKENNIVTAINESTQKKIWANLIDENGTDGGATWFGKRSVETCDKISKALTGRKYSDERAAQCKLNGAKSRKREVGEWSHSDASKKKLSESNLGKKQSTETIEKRRKKLLGHVVTDSTRAKISASNSGKKLSADHIDKIRNRVISESTKNKIREARKNQIITEETKQKLSGKVVVIDKLGNCSKILKSQYFSQIGPKNEWEWVAHRSKEAALRR